MKRLKRDVCPVCEGSKKSRLNFVLIAPWIRELTGVPKLFSSLYVCSHCSLGWSDICYTPSELNSLYSNYREDNYFYIRNKWESSYSQELNGGLNFDTSFHQTRKDFMTSLLDQVVPGFTSQSKVVVDIGGGHGAVMPDWESISHKFLVEVSTAIPTPSINKISSISEIPESLSPDLVMACGLLEHLNHPKDFVQGLMMEINSLKPTHEILFYFEVPNGVPKRRSNFLFLFAAFFSLFSLSWNIIDKLEFFKTSRFFPIRIAEHIQFFNELSLKILIEKSGMEVLAIKEYQSTDKLPGKIGLRFQQGIAAVARMPC
jgi:hypothetical protein